MKRFIWMIMLCVIGMMLVGCGENGNADTEKEVVFRYNGQDIYIDEVYVYARTVKERYESKYGKDVWGQSIVTDDGLEMNAEDSARRETISRIVKTKTLITKSDEYGISLTDSEQRMQEQDAEKFYELLTDEQIAEVGLEENTVKQVLEESALADKIYTYVMKQSSTEISDEQARMSTFYDMFFECYSEDDFGNITLYPQSKIDAQKKKADEAYAAIVEESDNSNLNISFLGSAKSLKYAGTHTMSRDEIVSTYGQDTLDILYSLSDGDISPVVQTEYGYHIFQMISLTDETATAENKEKLTEAADGEYYDNLMSDWIDELDSSYSYSKRVDMDVYNKISFK